MRSSSDSASPSASDTVSSAFSRSDSASSLGLGLLLGAARLLALGVGLDPVGLTLLERLTLLVEVGAEVVDHLGDRLAQRLLVLVGELAARSIRFISSPCSECSRDSRSVEEVADALDLDPVEVAAGAGVDRRHLVGDRERRALVLVQRLDQALAAGQRLLGLGVELGAELRERLELAELRQVQPQLPGDLLHRLRLGVASDSRDGDPDVDRRPDARVEEVGLEEDLAVGDRDHVRRDVGRDVSGLGLDDRQRRQRARRRARRRA